MSQKSALKAPSETAVLRLVDPVCGKTVTVQVSPQMAQVGVESAFCSTDCLSTYERLLQIRLQSMASEVASQLEM